MVGAGAGALVGLGVLAGTIPVIGPVMAIGTLGTILLNAAAGAAVVGLVGALVGLGIPEEDAKYYESEVRGGRFLVSVDAGNREAEAWAILRRAGGYNRSFPLSEPAHRPCGCRAKYRERPSGSNRVRVDRAGRGGFPTPAAFRSRPSSPAPAPVGSRSRTRSGPRTP